MLLHLFQAHPIVLAPAALVVAALYWVGFRVGYHLDNRRAERRADRARRGL